MEAVHALPKGEPQRKPARIKSVTPRLIANMRLDKPRIAPLAESDLMTRAMAMAWASVSRPARFLNIFRTLIQAHQKPIRRSCGGAAYIRLINKTCRTRTQIHHPRTGFNEVPAMMGAALSGIGKIASHRCRDRADQGGRMLQLTPRNARLLAGDRDLTGTACLPMPPGSAGRS